jgi:SAM-dependent methyltransferase
MNVVFGKKAHKLARELFPCNTSVAFYAPGEPMSEADRAKWDARYAANADHGSPQASRFLHDHLHLIDPGPALDIACGRGRNALLLAARGFTVDALDISAVALAHAEQSAQDKAVPVNWVCQDVSEDMNLPRAGYQLILMFHFVAFELLHTLAGALAPGGWLMVEEHLRWPTPVSGPASERFRVAPGQLAAAVPGLQTCFYHEGLVTSGDGADAAVAQLLARRPL